MFNDHVPCTVAQQWTSVQIIWHPRTVGSTQRSPPFWFRTFFSSPKEFTPKDRRNMRATINSTHQYKFNGVLGGVRLERIHNIEPDEETTLLDFFHLCWNNIEPYLLHLFTPFPQWLLYAPVRHWISLGHPHIPRLGAACPTEQGLHLAAPLAWENWWRFVETFRVFAETGSSVWSRNTLHFESPVLSPSLSSSPIRSLQCPNGPTFQLIISMAGCLGPRLSNVTARRIAEPTRCASDTAVNRHILTD